VFGAASGFLLALVLVVSVWQSWHSAIRMPPKTCNSQSFGHMIDLWGARQQFSSLMGNPQTFLEHRKAVICELGDYFLILS